MFYILAEPVECFNVVRWPLLRVLGISIFYRGVDSKNIVQWSQYVVLNKTSAEIMTEPMTNDERIRHHTIRALIGLFEKY